jgi:hypothetical protein
MQGQTITKKLYLKNRMIHQKLQNKMGNNQNCYCIVCNDYLFSDMPDDNWYLLYMRSIFLFGLCKF